MVFSQLSPFGSLHHSSPTITVLSEPLVFVDLHKSALELPKAAEKKGKNIFMKEEKQVGFFFVGGGAWTGTYM